MTREELILKWLDNDLNHDETRQFEALEDHGELIKLSNSLKKFKAPEYNTSEGLNAVMQTIQSKKSVRKLNWKHYVVRIAAVIAISLSAYYYTTTLDSEFSTLIAQKTTVDLPDTSEVTLNALSTISFNKRSWSDTRDVALNGEAFFKVAKGSSFNVHTNAGQVTVLGTEFNVKNRDDIFEVVCYEGSVQVTYDKTIKVLKPGDSFLILDGKYIAKEKENSKNPSWMNNESYFKSLPFGYVLNEFERQYGVKINSENLDLKQLFTGSFVHNDINLALKSITLPLNLKYSQSSDDTVILTRE